MTQGWTGFDWAHVRVLAAGAGWPVSATARDCPACGQQAVRAYLCEADMARRPTLVSYIWCTACRRFVGSRQPRPAGLVFTDPLAALLPERRRALEHSLAGFLAHLDRLWDEGVLPQSFDIR